MTTLCPHRRRSHSSSTLLLPPAEREAVDGGEGEEGRPWWWRRATTAEEKRPDPVTTTKEIMTIDGQKNSVSFLRSDSRKFGFDGSKFSIAWFCFKFLGLNRLGV